MAQNKHPNVPLFGCVEKKNPETSIFLECAIQVRRPGCLSVQQLHHLGLGCESLGDFCPVGRLTKGFV